MTPEWLAAVAPLVDALAWPVVFLVAVLLFLRPLRALLLRDDVSLTGPGGFGLTAKRRAQAVEALALAERKTGSTPSPAALRRDVDQAARQVGGLGRAPRLLWVDDRPGNNRHEVAAFEALGMAVELATSTDEALSLLEGAADHYDVVITDMGRPGDSRAGYTLLDALRAQGLRMPVVIYASSRQAAQAEEAVRRGALGCTDRPQELIDLVLRGIALR